MLEYIKNYLRVDYDEDDELIELLIGSAKEYIIDAIGYYDEDISRMKLLVAILCCEWYNNRGYVNTSSTQTVSENIKRTVESMLNQLRYVNDR